MTHPRPPSPAARVLYVTHRVPFPPDKGDRIRNLHLLRQLAARANVWLVALADEPVSAAADAALRGLCDRVAFVPTGGPRRWVRAAVSAATGGSLTEGLFREPAAVRVVERWAAEASFTAAVASSSGLAGYLRPLASTGVPAFLDLMDVDSQKWADFAAAARAPKRWVYALEAARVRRLERDLPTWAAGVSLVSAAEAAIFEGIAGPNTAIAATNGVDLDYFRPADVPEVPACAFVGAMDYLPNVDAAVWFATEVWPQIRREFPTAEFRVVGRSPVAAVRKLAAIPGVVVTGAVPDVRPFVASAAVAVVPVRIARGVQNKVLEALAMGKATVAAPPALAALGTVPGRHLLAATTPAEWVTAVCHLFRTPAARRDLGAAARGYVAAHHHWDRCLAPLVDRVVPPAAVPTPVRENDELPRRLKSCHSRSE